MIFLKLTAKDRNQQQLEQKPSGSSPKLLELRVRVQEETRWFRCLTNTSVGFVIGVCDPRGLWYNTCGPSVLQWPRGSGAMDWSTDAGEISELLSEVTGVIQHALGLYSSLGSGYLGSNLSSPIISYLCNPRHRCLWASQYDLHLRIILRVNKLIL